MCQKRYSKRAIIARNGCARKVIIARMSHTFGVCSDQSSAKPFLREPISLFSLNVFVKRLIIIALIIEISLIVYGFAHTENRLSFGG